ncbi:C2 calcium-dependent domain-containing protein 4B, partial [Ailuropoda melanoleuca]|uniref:C2 calcium-dependent domain-containing protein 4B n=1 Tax=Ailuropoda melanoleuca TaxID=9646 RepID=UPI000947A077
AEARAVGCRVSFVLRAPGKTRPQRSAVVRPSRKAAFDQDVCLDGLSEDQVRRLAVRVKAEKRGRGRERGRLLGQGELLLGSLLLP